MKMDKPMQGKRDMPDGVVPATNGRMAMGTSAYALTDDASSKNFAMGTAVRKGNSKGGNMDGFGAGTKVQPTPVMNNNRARFGIRVKMAGGPDPQLTSQTQMNGRIVRAVTRRTAPDFMAGQQFGRM